MSAAARSSSAQQQHTAAECLDGVVQDVCKTCGEHAKVLCRTALLHSGQPACTSACLAQAPTCCTARCTSHSVPGMRVC